MCEDRIDESMGPSLRKQLSQALPPQVDVIFLAEIALTHLRINVSDPRVRHALIKLTTLTTLIKALSVAEDVSIFCKDDTGTNMYIVEEGKLRVSVNDVTVMDLGRGDNFGELSLLYGIPRTATVKSLTAARMWSIDRRSFLAIQRHISSPPLPLSTQCFLELPEVACFGNRYLESFVRYLTDLSFAEGQSLSVANKSTFKVLLIKSGTVDVFIPPRLLRRGAVTSRAELLRRLGISVDLSSKPLPFDPAEHGGAELDFSNTEIESDDEEEQNKDDCKVENSVEAALSKIFEEAEAVAAEMKRVRVSALALPMLSITESEGNAENVPKIATAVVLAGESSIEGTSVGSEVDVLDLERDRNLLDQAASSLDVISTTKNDMTDTPSESGSYLLDQFNKLLQPKKRRATIEDNPVLTHRSSTENEKGEKGSVRRVSLENEKGSVRKGMAENEKGNVRNAAVRRSTLGVQDQVSGKHEKNQRMSMSSLMTSKLTPRLTSRTSVAEVIPSGGSRTGVQLMKPSPTMKEKLKRPSTSVSPVLSDDEETTDSAAAAASIRDGDALMSAAATRALGMHSVLDRSDHHNHGNAAHSYSMPLKAVHAAVDVLPEEPILTEKLSDEVLLEQRLAELVPLRKTKDTPSSFVRIGPGSIIGLEVLPAFLRLPGAGKWKNDVLVETIVDAANNDKTTAASSSASTVNRGSFDSRSIVGGASTDDVRATRGSLVQMGYKSTDDLTAPRGSVADMRLKLSAVEALGTIKSSDGFIGEEPAVLDEGGTGTPAVATTIAVDGAVHVSCFSAFCLPSVISSSTQAQHGATSSLVQFHENKELVSLYTLLSREAERFNNDPEPPRRKFDHSHFQLLGPMKESSDGCVGLVAMTNTVAMATTVKTHAVGFGSRRRSSVHDALFSLFGSQHSQKDNTAMSRKSSVYGIVGNKIGSQYSQNDSTTLSRKSSAYGIVGNKNGSQQSQKDSSPLPRKSSVYGIVGNKNHSAEADHAPASKIYFLKVTSKHKALGKFGGARRALEEAEILSIANWRHRFRRHPFIVQLIGTFQTNNALSLVLEKVDYHLDLWLLIYGGRSDPHPAVREAPRDQHRMHPNARMGMELLDPTLACFYAACVASALAHLHSLDIAHRNVKAENVLIDSAGFVRLTGFGCAKRFPYFDKNESSSDGVSVSDTAVDSFSSVPRLMTRSYTICGTAEYIAPEMLLVTGHSTPVDAWALGVLVCELLTGTSPFRKTADLAQASVGPLAPAPSLTHHRLQSDGAVLSVVAELQSLASPDTLIVPEVLRFLASDVDGGEALLTALLQPVAHNRMQLSTRPGSMMRQCQFFSCIDWNALDELRMPPPFIPAPPPAVANPATTAPPVNPFSKKLEKKADNKHHPPHHHQEHHHHTDVASIKHHPQHHQEHRHHTDQHHTSTAHQISKDPAKREARGSFSANPTHHDQHHTSTTHHHGQHQSPASSSSDPQSPNARDVGSNDTPTSGVGEGKSSSKRESRASFGTSGPKRESRPSFGNKEDVQHHHHQNHHPHRSDHHHHSHHHHDHHDDHHIDGHNHDEPPAPKIAPTFLDPYVESYSGDQSLFEGF